MVSNFFDRRLNLGVGQITSFMGIDAILDRKGKLVQTLGSTVKWREDYTTLLLSVDLTDDYLDPRTGVRLNVKHQSRPALTPDDPDTNVTDFSGLAYVPMFRADSLVINYFQSRADVTRKGNLDAGAIRTELGMNCAAGDQKCLTAEQDYVNNTINERRYGTATPLGGLNRLRSYTDGRFRGAHTAFAGIEYRWNFVREVKPFDYFIWKDVRTGFQLSFFSEVGSVAEHHDQLWDEARFSFGTGIRMLTGSGSVYRADVAVGDEGAQMAVFFFYPWE